MTFAQQPPCTDKRANIWYYGAQAGLDFNSGAPFELTNDEVDMYGGTSSICDAEGNLLLYTGTTSNTKMRIWNGNLISDTVVGGMNIYGDPSVKQGSLIIPKPYDKTKTLYYVITYGGTKYAPAAGEYMSLRYTLVDISAAGGRGATIERNVEISGDSLHYVMASTIQCGTENYWLVVHDFKNDDNSPSNNFLTYLITKDGIIPQDTISIGFAADNSYSNHLVGQQLKFSPDGQWLAHACNYEGIQLLKFDNVSGEISYPIYLKEDFNSGYYVPVHGRGVEFSPDNSKLYASVAIDYYTLAPFPKPNQVFQLLQYDLSIPDSFSIVNSEVILQEKEQTNLHYDLILGMMQLGPDKKIYIGGDGFGSHMPVIHEPNNSGTACNADPFGFEHSGVYTVTIPPSNPPFSRGVLPNFPSNFFTPTLEADFEYTQSCTEGLVTFQDQSCGDITGWQWNFGDDASSNNIDSFQGPSHLYKPKDSFEVVLAITDGCDFDTFRQSIFVDSAIELLTYGDTTILEGDSVLIGAISTKASAFSWTMGDENIDSNDNLIVSPLENKTYKIIVADSFGCKRTGQVVVEVIPIIDTPTIYIPNAFSPEFADGSNDIFRPYIIHSENIDKFYMTIFDRFGNMTFYTEDLDKGWNGSSKGNRSSGNVYVYLIELYDVFGQYYQFENTITIIR